MAFSKTKITEQLLGALKCQVYDLNFASVTSGRVSTGLSKVYAAHFNNETTEASGICYKNKSDASTADNGEVFIDSVTSNDLGTLTVIGV